MTIELLLLLLSIIKQRLLSLLCISTNLAPMALQRHFLCPVFIIPPG
jgi:hypothetical protein